VWTEPSEGINNTVLKHASRDGHTSCLLARDVQDSKAERTASDTIKGRLADHVLLS
jgi:hypothetical protein